MRDLTTIDQRVVAIRNDPQAVDTFISEYTPFVISCARKVSGKYWLDEQQDEYSTALYAFLCAIQAYDAQKGKFLTFAKNVIRTQLIDEHRKNQKHSNRNIPIENSKEQENYFICSASLEQFYREDDAEYRRWEIRQFKQELALWGITLDELLTVSPKHFFTRTLCCRAVDFVYKRPDLSNQVLKKRTFPFAEIEKSLKIPKKKLERFRKYLIAMLILKAGDYEYLKAYVSEWR